MITFRRVSNPFVCTLSTRIQTIPNMEKVISISNANIPNSVPMDELDYEEMLQIVPRTGNPTQYAVKRSGSDSVTLIFDSTFATATTLTVEGEEKASTLSGSNVPAFSESFHDILVYGAYADELRKGEKITLARDADAEFERRLSELRHHVAVSAYKDVVQGKLNTSPIPMGGNTILGGGSAAGNGAFDLLTVNGLATFLSDMTVAGNGSFKNLDIIAGGSHAAARIYRSAANGLSVGAVAGSSFDFSLLDPSGVSRIAQVPTGTVNIEFKGTLTERGRTTPIGEWIDVTFAAGNFTSDAGTWTLTAGDQTTFRYMLVGKTLYVIFELDTTSTAGAGTDLRIVIPGGFTSQVTTVNPIHAADNGTRTSGYAIVAASGTLILCRRTDEATWANAANTTFVHGQIMIPIP